MKILTQYPTTQKFLFDGYDLPSNATKNYDNNHENDVEDVSTSLFQHKIITNDYSKLIMMLTLIINNKKNNNNIISNIITIKEKRKSIINRK